MSYRCGNCGSHPDVRFTCCGNCGVYNQDHAVRSEDYETVKLRKEIEKLRKELDKRQ